MKNKKIIIGLAGVLTLASLILIIIFIINKPEKKSELEIKLSDMAVDYYENTYKKAYPNFLKQMKTLQVDLDSLKGMKKDITFFENQKCDLTNTYVVFTYKNETSYEISVHLACEE